MLFYIIIFIIIIIISIGYCLYKIILSIVLLN